MKKRYAFRAYPTGGQVRTLARVYGCCRLVFNNLVSRARRDHAAGVRYRGAHAYQKEVLTAAKQTPELSFLREVPGVPLIQALRDADLAYRNFFSSLAGTRKGRRVGAPRFRSRKDHRQAARFSSAARFTVAQDDGERWANVHIPGIGDLRFRSSRMLPSTPSSVTVIRKASGHYYVSFVVNALSPEPLPATDHAAGIDLGLTDLATIAYSDGTREKIAAPKHLRRKERALARAQRELARRQKGSKNREKSRAKVARIHEKVADTRLDHHHKLASRIVRENQAIGLETLSIKGLARTRLARSIHDAGWGILARLIEEKAREHDRVVAREDRFAPTTRTCAACGSLSGKKPLSIRVWDCEHCGTVLDRDYNAATNIMVAAGLAETQNACGGDVRRQLAAADLTAVPRHAKQEPPELTRRYAA